MATHKQLQAAIGTFDGIMGQIAGRIGMGAEDPDRLDIVAWSQKVRSATNSMVLMGLVAEAPADLGALAAQAVIARMGVLAVVAAADAEPPKVQAVSIKANKSGGIFLRKQGRYSVNMPRAADLVDLLDDRGEILAALAELLHGAKLVEDTVSTDRGNGATTLTRVWRADSLVLGAGDRGKLLGDRIDSMLGD
jgi:hypothetical protein